MLKLEFITNGNLISHTANRSTQVNFMIGSRKFLYASCVKMGSSENVAVKRRELFSANKQAQSSGGQNSLPSAGLDTSLKKNSAMVNKLKAITTDTSAKLIEELRKLQFEKFIAEYPASFMESLLKARNGADILAIVQVMSHVHQRLPSEFARSLLTELLKLVLPCQHKAKPLPSSGSSVIVDPKADQSRTNQIRLVVRIITEMTLCGVIECSWLTGKTSIVPGYAQMALLEVSDSVLVKDMLAQEGGLVYSLLWTYMHGDDKQDNAAIVSYFAKYCYADFVSVSSAYADSSAITVSQTVAKMTADLFKSYYDTAAKRYVSVHVKLNKMKSYSEDLLITRGTLTDQQKLRLEEGQALLELLTKLVSSLAESLQYTIPDLPSAEKEKGELSGITVIDPKSKLNDRADIDWYLTPWDDEEIRAFYCDIPDLMNLVNPAALMQPSQKKKKKRERKKKTEDDFDFEDDFYDEVDEEVVKSIEREQEKDEENLTSPSSKNTPSDNVDSILQSLPDLINVQLIDDAVIQFCNAMVNNRDSALTKLITTFCSVSRFRTDVLPYYSRFIASIHKYIPEVGNTVVASLLSEFRRRFRKQDPFQSEHRRKNVRFLGELAKYQICPPHLIFYCFKRLSQPEGSGGIFSNAHVLVACALLETCGRYMNRTPEIGKLFMPLVEIFEKKCKQASLESHVFMMVENALLMTNPPPPKKIEIVDKPRTLLELWVRKLIYEDLNPKSVDSVLDSLRRLPWNQKIEMKIFKKPNLQSEDAQEEPVDDAIQVFDTRGYLSKMFFKIWKIKFSNVELMADLVSGLSKYYPSFGHQLLDSVCEDVRFGMEELTHFDFYQRRILMVRYLGELYNFRVAPSELIFSTLYSLISFGHTGGKPGKSGCALDPPDDYFRIRLICELLDTCGQYYGRGSLKKALDNYFVFFEYYIKIKNPESLSLETQFAIDDLLNKLRPQWIRCKTFEEADEKLHQLQRDVHGQDLEDDGMGVEDEQAKGDDEVSSSDSDDSDDDSVSTESVSDGEDFKREAVMTGPTKEEEEQFAKEFQELMSESLASRRNEKKSVLDLAIPILSKEASASSLSSANSEPIPMMKFRVLSKGKSSHSSIAVPADSLIAQSAIKKQQELQKEKLEIKRRVLASQRENT